MRRSAFTRRPHVLANPEMGASEPTVASLPPAIASELVSVPYDGKHELNGRVFKVRSWDRWDNPRRLAFMRAFTVEKARDPAIAVAATRILRAARVKPRDYRAQWAALLAWVQRNVMYVNERDERLASPQFTLAHRLADCDDDAMLVAALGDSLRLPWRFVISGRDRTGRKHRWIEGEGSPDPMVDYTHIYLAVGWPPFGANPVYVFAEPTLRVPLGWDVVDGPQTGETLPEME